MTALRSLAFVIAVLAGLSCGSVGGATPATGAVNEMASDVSPAPESFSLVDLHPAEGDLPALLAAHAGQAATLERNPFVEFSATWCSSCAQLAHSLDDERMIEAFEGTYIIRLDLDEWKSRLSQTDFVVLGVPTFFEVDEEGRPTGRTITGAAWAENIPENMAPVLGEFFHFES
jgi:thiol:disulfide interchange protein